jgi:hypothetical protein
MTWDGLGINDFENIPGGYLVNWRFINAFLLAFQERADYIEGAERAETYNDLIFNGPQVSTLELQSRLSTLNGNVTSCFNTTWLKEQTWTDLSGFSVGLTDIGSSGRNDPGLDVIDIVPWDEQELRDLLTDEVYEDIFELYSYYVSFKASYWSGLYKLLKYVMLYRTLTIRTNYDPDPDEPYLMLIQKEGFSDSEPNLNLNSLVTQSKTGTTVTNGGNKLIRRGAITASSTYKVSNRNNIFSESFIDISRVRYNSLTIDPFCKVPAQMNIQTLLWRDFGNIKNERSDETQQGSLKNRNNSSVISEPISASRTEVVTDFVHSDPVYSPSEEGFSRTAENPKLPISYADGKCSLSIDGLTDLRDTYSISPEQAPKVLPDFSVGYAQTDEVRGQSVDYYLNYAACELPQGEFNYPV